MQEQGLSKFRLAICLDGEVADIDIDPSRSVRDLIKHALSAFGAVENASMCRLYGGGRLFSPEHQVSDLGDGATLALLLPI